MNKIFKKFLLIGDKFMQELRLKQPVFIYSACVAFTKYRKRTKEFRETSNLKNLQRNE